MRTPNRLLLAWYETSTCKLRIAQKTRKSNIINFFISTISNFRLKRQSIEIEKGWKIKPLKNLYIFDLSSDLKTFPVFDSFVEGISTCLFEAYINDSWHIFRHVDNIAQSRHHLLYFCHLVIYYTCIAAYLCDTKWSCIRKEEVPGANMRVAKIRTRLQTSERRVFIRNGGFAGDRR